MKKTMIRAAALLLAVPLALAGCSGGSDTTPSIANEPTAQEEVAIYEFGPTPTDPVSSLAVRIPDALATLASDQMGDVPVTEYRISGRVLPSAEYCAADLAPTYAQGAIDRLTQPQAAAIEWDEAEAQARAEESAIREATGNPNVVIVDWGYDLSTYYETNYGPGSDYYEQGWVGGGYIRGSQPAWGEAEYEAGLKTIEERTPEIYEETKATYDAENAERLNRAPGANLTSGLGLSFGSPIEELDESSPDPEKFVYYSSDLSVITLLQKCTRDLESSGTRVNFGELASVDLGMMTDGTVLVLESDVSGFETDMSGNWIAD